MKRSPDYYHNRKLLRELKDDDIKFRPKIGDIKEWFDILNEQIFSNKLSPLTEMRVCKLEGFHGVFLYWNKSEEQEPELEMHKVFKSKKLFVEILAHEMIHYFQYTHDEPVTHGSTFVAWRENFNLKGLTLHKVA